MMVLPAIDIRGGQCVRLQKGEFDAQITYDRRPQDVAAGYCELGAPWLHTVDLDGAQTGTAANASVVAEMIAQSDAKIQIGGGIRDDATFKQWLDAGAARCVIGSLLVKAPDTVRGWCEQFGADCVVAAVDVRFVDGDYRVAVAGWTETSALTLWDCLKQLSGWGIRDVLCTDISRDGMMQGPNVELYTDILARFPQLRLQASGGVGQVSDLYRLRDAGIPSAIVGKALLEGTISNEELSSFLANA